jgi:hypothetical protein
MAEDHSFEQQKDDALDRAEGSDLRVVMERMRKRAAAEPSIFDWESMKADRDAGRP